MNKWLIGIILTVVILVVAIVAFNLGSKSVLEVPSSPSPPSMQSNTEPAANASTPALEGNQTIIIENLAFNPSELRIKVGNQITWINNDRMSHTVSSNIGYELNSGKFSQGAVYKHTFNTIGTFNYHCNIYPMMKGKIIVE